MSYTPMEVSYFLALVVASNVQEAQGHAEAMHVAGGLSPSVQTTWPEAQLKTLSSEFAGRQGITWTVV